MKLLLHYVFVRNVAVFIPLKFLIIFLFSLIFLNVNSFSQENVISVQFDEREPELPFKLYSTATKNVSVIKLIVLAPSKFASYLSESDDITVTPIGETTLLITCDNAIGINCFSNSDQPLISFITDDTSYEQDFLAEFQNSNHQSVGESIVRISVPAGFPLPGPCSQSFISFNTGVGINPNQIDPHWHFLSNQMKNPTFAINNNYPVQSPGANWINYVPWWGLENSYFTYIRNFCATSASNGFVSLCIAADNNAKVFFNNQQIAQTTGGFYGFMQLSCINNVPVQILASTNEIRVEVFNRESLTGFIITNSSITTDKGVLGLSSDRCCGDNVGGRVFGKKIWDINCNGRVDPGENGLAGWTITLTDPSGGVQTATTDQFGNYSFSNLNPGTYTLSEQLENGWTQSTSAGPFSVYVNPNDNVHRDFLNCKPPDCADIFSHYQNSDECCSSEFIISNANNAALQTLSFTVTGGVINSINTNVCNPASNPVNLNGATSGTLTFNTSCTQQNPLIFYINASSNTADGLICINWNADFVQGGQTFACQTETCIRCDRMPQICDKKLSVTANVFGPVNTDYRNFVITNSKIPFSAISSVDIEFINESNPPHIGGGLKVDGNNRNWTYNNSGGPTAAYTLVRLGCSGQSATHGPAGQNSIEFNLGVDNTTIPLYSGIVNIKIGYCDGDTCLLEYVWQPPVKTEHSDLLRKAEVPVNPHALALEISLLENATHFGITLDREDVKILAVTPPALSNELSADSFIGYKVFANNNAAFFIKENPSVHGENDRLSLTILYQKDDSVGLDTIPVIARFFDNEGKEIGYSAEAMKGIIISHIDDNFGNKDIKIDVLPNPVESSAVIKLELQNDEQVSISVYDVSSREVMKIISNTMLQSGNYNFNIHTGELTAGTYFVKLKTKSSSQILKMIIIK